MDTFVTKAARLNGPRDIELIERELVCGEDDIIVKNHLMAIMGFMAAQLIATTLRGSAESAGQIKDLTEATSTLEECIAYLNTEAMQQKAARDLITDKGLEALLEAQDKRELWHPDGCPSCPDNLLITVKRGSVELSRAF